MNKNETKITKDYINGYEQCLNDLHELVDHYELHDYITKTIVNKLRVKKNNLKEAE